MVCGVGEGAMLVHGLGLLLLLFLSFCPLFRRFAANSRDSTTSVHSLPRCASFLLCFFFFSPFWCFVPRFPLLTVDSHNVATFHLCGLRDCIEQLLRRSSAEVMLLFATVTFLFWRSVIVLLIRLVLRHLIIYRSLLLSLAIWLHCQRLTQSLDICWNQ